MFGENLRHWKAEAAARRGGIVFRDLALAVQRVDAKADVETLALGAEPVEQRTKARDLARRVEDQMIGERRDLGQIGFLVARAIGCDLTPIFLAPQLRLVQARRADAVEIFGNGRPEEYGGEEIGRAHV